MSTGRGPAGADRPDRLVREHQDFAQALDRSSGLHRSDHRADLAVEDVLGLAGGELVFRLADAKHDTEIR